ncbi:hypothetical protein K438DRAFT_1991544 [Mycena galopus ATCC 62051]|nr:hypothetical protein K438DRAFT_1991544 [Mycena galopus ATCC 62051]
MSRHGGAISYTTRKEEPRRWHHYGPSPSHASRRPSQQYTQFSHLLADEEHLPVNLPNRRGNLPPGSDWRWRPQPRALRRVPWASPSPRDLKRTRCHRPRPHPRRARDTPKRPHPPALRRVSAAPGGEDFSLCHERLVGNLKAIGAVEGRFDGDGAAGGALGWGVLHLPLPLFLMLLRESASALPAPPIARPDPTARVFASLPSGAARRVLLIMHPCEAAAARPLAVVRSGIHIDAAAGIRGGARVLLQQQRKRRMGIPVVTRS